MTRKMQVGLARKTLGRAMAALLLLGLIVLTFPVQLAEARLQGNHASPLHADSSAPLVDNELYADRASPKILKHRTTTPEFEELKEYIGVGAAEDSIEHVNGYGTGLRPPTEEEWEQIAKESMYIVEEVTLNTTQVPSSVDHSASQWFPPIGSQGTEGSCVAWAVGYYMKSFQEAKEHNWDLSDPLAPWTCRDKFVSPDFVYHLINGGIDGGSHFYDAITLVCSVGACSWEKMPYDASDSSSWPSEEAWREAPLYRGGSNGFEHLLLETDEGLINLKNLIASDNLAVISVDSWKYSSLTSNDVWTLDNYVNPSENHANTVVGYDDDFEYVELGESRRGAFKVANSWGEGSWETIPDGCYWISYEAMKQRVSYCMFYRDMVGYKPGLLSSFRIDHARRGECVVSIGVGKHWSPYAVKWFSSLTDGGNHPFCANNIVLDITEFKDAGPVYNESLFLRVLDWEDSTTGKITDFSVEYYRSNSSSTPDLIATSKDTPIDTATGELIYVDLLLKSKIDFDGDGKIDVEDIIIAVSAYGSRPGDANWIPDADLAPMYGIINIFDLVTLAYHYGKTFA